MPENIFSSSDSFYQNFLITALVCIIITMSTKNVVRTDKVTITDIAKASSVSPATVSLVLRDKAGVGKETRQRVLETAQSLGYIPPATTRDKPADKQYKQIGLVMKIDPNNADEINHFYSPVVTGIELICRQRKSNLLYANIPVDQFNQPFELPWMLTDEQLDGLLIIGMELTAGLLSHLNQQSMPIVLVDGYATGDPFDAIVTDNQKGAEEATNFLINRGHKQIALIGSQTNSYPSIRERREGYIKAMQNSGLSTIFGDCDLRPGVVDQVVTEVLNNHPDVTAFFGCNDEVAIAIINSLEEIGKKVPKEVSVIGFDNIVLSQHIRPSLTTMRVDKMAMGRHATHLLFNRLEYPESGIIKTIIQPQLFVRESA